MIAICDESKMILNLAFENWTLLFLYLPKTKEWISLEGEVLSLLFDQDNEDKYKAGNRLRNIGGTHKEVNHLSMVSDMTTDLFPVLGSEIKARCTFFS